jgi:hypothetical protein
MNEIILDEVEPPKKRTKKAKEPEKPYGTPQEIATACHQFVVISEMLRNNNKRTGRAKKAKRLLNERLLRTMETSGHNLFNVSVNNMPYAVQLGIGEGKRKWKEEDLIAKWIHISNGALNQDAARALYKAEHEDETEDRYSLKILKHNVTAVNLNGQ